MLMFRLMLLATVFLFSGCDKPQVDTKETPKQVKVITVAPRQSLFIYHFPARINASNSTELAFKQFGQLELRTLREGEYVKKGEILARLDDREVKHRIADRRSAYDTAQRQYNRYAELGKQHLISQSELDMHKSHRDSALASYKLVQEELKDRVLKAPYSGVISKIHQKDHHYVSAGQPVMTFEDIDNIDVTFNVSERVFDVLRLPKSDLVYNVAFSVLPGQLFPARYKEHTVNNTSGSMTWQVTLTLPRPEQISHLSGMSGTVTIDPPFRSLLDISPPVLVPASSVVNPDSAPNGKAAVWVLHYKPDHNYVELRWVTLGAISAHYIEVKEGLQSGETVVAAGVNGLKPNQRVTIWQRESGL